MAHGGYGNRRVAARKPPVGGRRSKGAGVQKNPKPKSVTPKNQIRSVERMLRKELSPEVRAAQEKKLQGIKRQQEIHARLALERKLFLRDKKIKFFERRKIERSIRRLEKVHRAASAQAHDSEVSEQLLKLKEDLEYVRFFPKSEKYLSLFNGGGRADIVDKRNKLREQIKANLVAAAASGKDLEETGSEDDGLLDVSEDDFFVGGSSDEADADDEWTEQSPREQASSASGKAASGMSSDERNQRHKPAKAPMRPPRPSNHSHSNSVYPQSRFGASSSNNSWRQGSETSASGNMSSNGSGISFKGRGVSPNARTDHSSNLNHSHSNSVYPQSRFGASSSNNSWRQGSETSASGNVSSSGSGVSFRGRGVSSNERTGHSSNLSSNSDAHAHKPRRKRRPKKKKQ